MERKKVGKFRDLTGLRFGRLIVIDLWGKSAYGFKWNCICDCGKSSIVLGSNLVTGNTSSCGCYGKEKIIEAQRIDITGRKFGRLTALYISGKSNTRTNRQMIWHCVCDCGNEVDVNTHQLISGHTQSCGCYNRDQTSKSNKTHGLSKTPEYARFSTRKRLEKEKELDVLWVFDYEIFLADMFPACVVCGGTDRLATDHVYPLDLGYGLKPGNATRLCIHCNSKKRKKIPSELSPETRDKILGSAEIFRAFLQD